MFQPCKNTYPIEVAVIDDEGIEVTCHKLRLQTRPCKLLFYAMERTRNISCVPKLSRGGQKERKDNLRDEIYRYLTNYKI